MWLVWRKTMRGELAPSLDRMNPQASLDWKLHEQTVAQIIPVPEHLQAKTLDEVAAALPCAAT